LSKNPAALRLDSRIPTEISEFARERGEIRNREKSASRRLKTRERSHPPTSPKTQKQQVGDTFHLGDHLLMRMSK
jgi:hypothetical protein